MVSLCNVPQFIFYFQASIEEKLQGRLGRTQRKLNRALTRIGELGQLEADAKAETLSPTSAWREGVAQRDAEEHEFLDKLALEIIDDEESEEIEDSSNPFGPGEKYVGKIINGMIYRYGGTAVDMNSFPDLYDPADPLVAATGYVEKDAYAKALSDGYAESLLSADEYAKDAHAEEKADRQALSDTLVESFPPAAAYENGKAGTAEDINIFLDLYDPADPLAAARRFVEKDAYAKA